MERLSRSTDFYRVLQVDPEAHPNVITAAYRALARMAHPDQTREPDDEAMKRLNRAYAVLRDPARRSSYDRERATPAGARSSQPGAAVAPPPFRSSAGGTVLAHGRYAGWSLEQLVRHDPDYLRWLARHTSGRHHRAEIERLLAGRRAVAYA